MYIYKKAYLAIKDNIKQHCPSINYIALWNNQPNNRDREQAIPTPAVYIEFLDFDFENVQGKGKVQTAQGRIILHVEQEIITELYSTKDKESDNQDDALKRFDIMQELHLAMQGFTLPFLKGVSRITTDPDYDHDNLIIDTVPYRATLIDEPDEQSGEFVHIDKYKQEITIDGINIDKGSKPDEQRDTNGYDIIT